MFEIQGKVAIVTGGANGIGKEAVKAILKKGGIPVIADFNEDLGNQTAEELNVEFVKVDVSDETQVKEMVSYVVEKYGHLDIMVANAGIGGGGSTLDLPTAEYEKYIGINQNGVFYCSREAIRQMVAQGTGGGVINVSSILGLVGSAGACFYNISKGAVRLMTKSMAVEFAPHNIRVNSIHPGYIITGMVNEDVAGAEGIEMLKSLHPLSKGIERLGKPEEIAHAIIFAIENTFMTGAEIVVDGGYTAQ